VDILDDPALGGGMRHVAEVTVAYFRGDSRKDAELLDYAARHGNRTIYKRLGYLIEAMDIEAPNILKACEKARSSGLTRLDPAGPKKSRIVKRWNLRVNVVIVPDRETP
jgi:predicted transcriptional regulator of viral defense system